MIRKKKRVRKSPSVYIAETKYPGNYLIQSAIEEKYPVPVGNWDEWLEMGDLARTRDLDGTWRYLEDDIEVYYGGVCAEILGDQEKEREEEAEREEEEEEAALEEAAQRKREEEEEEEEERKREEAAERQREEEHFYNSEEDYRGP